MKLIDIFPVISNNYKLKIGVNGDFIGTFEKDEVTFGILDLTVKSIYPIVVDGGNGNIHKYIGLDLIRRKEEEKWAR